MRHTKLNQNGLTHLIGLVAFIAVFAAIGGYLLLKSQAATDSTKCPYDTICGTVRRNGNTVDNSEVLILRLKNNIKINTVYAYTDSNGYYHHSPINTGINYIIYARKKINGAKYCSNEGGFWPGSSQEGVRVNLNLIPAQNVGFGCY